MQYTVNYNLKKLDLADSPPDITQLNSNWDAIDLELQGLSANKANKPETNANAAFKLVGVTDDGDLVYNPDLSYDAVTGNFSVQNVVVSDKITDGNKFGGLNLYSGVFRYGVNTPNANVTYLNVAGSLNVNYKTGSNFPNYAFGANLNAAGVNAIYTNTKLVYINMPNGYFEAFGRIGGMNGSNYINANGTVYINLPIYLAHGINAAVVLFSGLCANTGATGMIGDYALRDYSVVSSSDTAASRYTNIALHFSPVGGNVCAILQGSLLIKAAGVRYRS